MRKLLGIKEWVLLEDAAAYLQHELGEAVRPADVLQLGCDGALQLSVRFVNGALARVGRLGTPELTLDGVGAPVLVFDDDDADFIEGVWDLSLTGDGALALERRMQELTQGPEVDRFTLAGLHVMTPTQDTWAALVELDIRSVTVDPSIQVEAPWGGKVPLISVSKRYLPSHELPEGAVLVVRPAALAAFLGNLRDGDRPSDQAVGAGPIRAVPALRAQEDSILQMLRELGFDPAHLPAAAPGKPSPAKEAIKHALGYSPNVLKKAWARLRADGRLAGGD